QQPRKARRATDEAVSCLRRPRRAAGAAADAGKRARPTPRARDRGRDPAASRPPPRPREPAQRAAGRPRLRRRLDPRRAPPTRHHPAHPAQTKARPGTRPRHTSTPPLADRTNQRLAPQPAPPHHALGTTTRALPRLRPTRRRTHALPPTQRRILTPLTGCILGASTAPGLTARCADLEAR